MVTNVTREALAQAQLRGAVATKLAYIAEDLEEKRLNAVPSNSRLGGLANSLAWHAERATPEGRLLWFKRELTRLARKTAAESAADEAKLYDYLLATLTFPAVPTEEAAGGTPEQADDNLAREEEVGARNTPWRIGALAALRVPDEEREAWGTRLDLLLAVAAVRMLQVRARGARLIAQIEEHDQGKVRLS
jgi:hypothetical protein